jgi:hypothetical protein
MVPLLLVMPYMAIVGHVVYQFSITPVVVYGIENTNGYH